MKTTNAHTKTSNHNFFSRKIALSSLLIGSLTLASFGSTAEAVAIPASVVQSVASSAPTAATKTSTDAKITAAAKAFRESLNTDQRKITNQNFV